jgi:hypothetical protein
LLFDLFIGKSVGHGHGVVNLDGGGWLGMSHFVMECGT